MDNEQRNDSELIQYIVVNKELEMSVGKTASQVGHGVNIVAYKHTKPFFEYPLQSFEAVSNYLNFERWINEGQKKIVLKGTEKELEKLISLGGYPVHDSGLTEIEPDSLTVVAFPPSERVKMRKIIGRLRLL